MRRRKNLKKKKSHLSSLICTNYLLRIPSTFKFIDDDEAAGYAVNDDAVNVDNDVVVVDDDDDNDDDDADDNLALYSSAWTCFPLANPRSFSSSFLAKKR